MPFLPFTALTTFKAVEVAVCNRLKSLFSLCCTGTVKHGLMFSHVGLDLFQAARKLKFIAKLCDSPFFAIRKK